MFLYNNNVLNQGTTIPFWVVQRVLRFRPLCRPDVSLAPCFWPFSCQIPLLHTVHEFVFDSGRLPGYILFTFVAHRLSESAALRAAYLRHCFLGLLFSFFRMIFYADAFPFFVFILFASLTLTHVHIFKAFFTLLEWLGRMSLSDRMGAFEPCSYCLGACCGRPLLLHLHHAHIASVPLLVDPLEYF